MQIFGSGSNAYTETDTGVNADAASTTTPLEMNGARLAAFYVVANSGTHATHVITLQVSPDGINWQDTTLPAHSITGIGNLHDIGCAAHSIRCKVTTQEGGVSTVDITVLVK